MEGCRRMLVNNKSELEFDDISFLFRFGRTKLNFPNTSVRSRKDKKGKNIVLTALFKGVIYIPFSLSIIINNLAFTVDTVISLLFRLL